MGIGTGIFLIVAGAILSFGIEPDAWSVVNLNIVGYILMAGGLVALILALVEVFAIMVLPSYLTGAVGFVMLVLVLVLRPGGLFGHKVLG